MTIDVRSLGTIAIVSIASLSFTSCATDEHDDVVHWGYEAEDGPDRWAAMNPEWMLCTDGQGQSPIDISGPTTAALPPTEIRTPTGQEVALLNQAGVIGALDNGHTIQINARTGETVTVGEDTYALLQFHFHAPSEHTVNGEHFPMELHFVHLSEDGGLAVVGVLIEEGAHNPGVGALWEQLENAPGTATPVRISTDFADYIFPPDTPGIYYYDGSLTTPPCTEGVKWYIRTAPTQLSAEQIAEFTAVYDHNNRPVQALNARELRVDENPDVTIY